MGREGSCCWFFSCPSRQGPGTASSHPNSSICDFHTPLGLAQIHTWCVGPPPPPVQSPGTTAALPGGGSAPILGADPVTCTQRGQEPAPGHLGLLYPIEERAGSASRNEASWKELSRSCFASCSWQETLRSFSQSGEGRETSGRIWTKGPHGSWSALCVEQRPRCSCQPTQPLQDIWQLLLLPLIPGDL